MKRKKHGETTASESEKCQVTEREESAMGGIGEKNRSGMEKNPASSSRSCRAEISISIVTATRGGQEVPLYPTIGKGGG